MIKELFATNAPSCGLEFWIGRSNLIKTKSYELSITTQGPTYPPSEVMDADGNFIVIGQINRTDLNGITKSSWGAAIVSAESPVPEFGQQAPYTILRELTESLTEQDRRIELYTLPIPLPCPPSLAWPTQP